MELTPVDPTSPQPPFEQLRVQIATQVGSGELAPGTRLPTVRALASELGLAVNTVARAYRELEADGVVVTEGRRGTFVRSTRFAGTEAAQAAAADYVAVTRRLGLSLPDAVRLVERRWSEPQR